MTRLLGLMFLICAALKAATIDAIAVTVGNQAITQTEIARDIEIAALMNGEDPKFTVETRREAATRLVEQALIRREMSYGNYPPIPDAQVAESLAATEKARGGTQAFSRILTSRNLTVTDLKDYMRWQLALLRFIDLRFRPAVEVTDEDIENYYKQNIAKAPAPDGAVPSLRDLHDQIEQKLTGERVDEQLNQWIHESREHTAIRYLDASLATTTPEGGKKALP